MEVEDTRKQSIRDFGKRLLIAGGSHAEVPVIEAAKDRGWYVISTGNDEGAPGHLLADEYIKGDYSDQEFVYRLAKEKQVSAIVSGANDFSYLSTSYACEKLGLPGHDCYETAKIIHTKDRFRRLQEELGLPCPRSVKCRDSKELSNFLKESITNNSLEIRFPLLIKPADLTGGKGIAICKNKEETIEAFDRALKATRKDYVVLEQYIEGSRHGCSVLLKNQRVVFSFFDNEQYGESPYLVKGASAPSDIPEYTAFSLIRDIEKIAQHLNLVDGLFHVQFILTEEGIPVMIDPCRRMPGDLYILLVKYTTGVDYPAEILKAETGGTLFDAYRTEHNFIARECIMTRESGRIESVYLDSELNQHLIDSFLKENEGQWIDDPLKYKAGILILKFPSWWIMQDILGRFDELARIEFVEEVLTEKIA